MSENVVGQGFSLLQGLVLGLGTGFLYDLCRVLRRRVKIPFLGHFLDFFFWIFVTFVIFLWSQSAWMGRIRLYGVCAITLGAIFYFFTFTSIFLWIGFRFADFTEFLMKLLYSPVTFFVFLEKKIKKFIKNLFLFWWKWYRIEGMTEAFEKQATSTEKGGVGHSHYAGRHTHKNRHRRYNYLSRWVSAKRGWRDTIHTTGSGATSGTGSSHGRRK